MRKLTGPWKVIVDVLSVLLITFQIYTTARGPFSDIIQRSVHLSFVLTLLFLLKPPRKLKEGEEQHSVPWYDVVLALLSAACCVYPTGCCTTRCSGCPGSTRSLPWRWWR